MILVCNREYEVTVLTRRPRTAFEHRSTVVLHLIYCGGSCVDSEGHHIGGGVWVHSYADKHHRHQDRKQYFDLPILHIAEAKRHS